MLKNQNLDNQSRTPHLLLLEGKNECSREKQDDAKKKKASGTRLYLYIILILTTSQNPPLPRSSKHITSWLVLGRFMLPTVCCSLFCLVLRSLAPALSALITCGKNNHSKCIGILVGLSKR